MDHPEQATLRDGDLLLRRWTTENGEELLARATFLVEWRGNVAGSVEVRQLSEGVGSLSWVVHEPYRGQGIATRAVRLVIDFAFSTLGLGRVEARVNPLNRSALRVALRAGLRREGLLRANVRSGAQTDDTVLLGRLENDPAPGTREGFTAMLDSALPLKRAIAQGVLRNERGDILLCELAYKAEWDLPGGSSTRTSRRRAASSVRSRRSSA
ncbi:GNAT family N-acetyltransferase [Intrasporangium calvum]|uniref:GNAT family N-acetyltransferase n=1 Tax=Intrasporangium calvum TaxID=53358 RepID=UPI001F343246|nr:GNAT family protein [Intrasporangium calvum]